MSDIKPEDLVEKVETSSTENAEAQTEAQDPLKTELDKVREKEVGGSKYTKREKLTFTKKKIDEQLRELDEEEGVMPSPEEDDDSKPLTIGEFKRIQQQSIAKSALQLAEDITNETERELTKYHLSNSIKSTGNPQEDLRLARAIVNDSKNKKILEELDRKNPAKTKPSGSSAPARFTADHEEELTPDEILFTKAPFNMTKAQILEVRSKK